MRQFVMSSDGKGLCTVVLSEDDVFGVIGEVLSHISQLDDGETLMITCCVEGE